MMTEMQVQGDFFIAEPDWEVALDATQIGAGTPVTGIDDKFPEPNRRSDAEIALSVISVLQWTTFLPSKAIKVTVKDGWVTLAGEVERQYQCEPAARAVRHLMGVIGVVDQITVKFRDSPGFGA
jgi:osmotically-inducible protein OsmY